MQTQGASSLWGGNSGLSGLDSNWGMSTPSYSSGANNMNLLGYGGNSLSNNQGHMQSGASSTLVDSINVSRGGWGAPGTIPPSQSTKLPTSSSGNMQGSLPVSGAQQNGPQSNQASGSLTTSQSPGPNGGMSSQGNSAFGNAGFHKISTGNTSSGLAINPATSINSSNGSSAQSNDNLGNSAGWGVPSSQQDSRLMGTNSWGGNQSGADWDQTSTSVSQSPGSNPDAGGSGDQRPSSWAQAAGKGLNLQANNQTNQNSMSPEELQRQTAMKRAIESHDGWGKKPINQVTKWSIETSPKVQRKISTASVVPDQQQQKGTNNMWNNNNGTAIWEADKGNNSAWSGNPAARAPGQPPSNWQAAQKPPDASVGQSQWGMGTPGQVPGGDKGMAPWVGPPGNQSNNAQWGGSTETGYFGGLAAGASSGSGGGISTWGEGEGSAGWGDNRNPGANDGTSYWGDPPNKPQTQPPNWNTPGAPPGQQAIGQNRKMTSGGWGDPMGPPDPKSDDGTSLWTSTPQQAPPRGPGGWTSDPSNQAQWNPAIGKPNPKPVDPSQYGGVDDLNWNLPKDDIWSEESMGGWDDADMGTWNDTAQQSNSTWNSATGWNKDKRPMMAAKEGAGPGMKFPGATNHPPQMRSRLLQQLMDMGFKKDDAQHALITNNMNIQNAIADLYSRRGATMGKKDDFDIGRMPGLMPDNDISDTQPDNSFVPNMNHMQNTPFNNAQGKLPNQFPYNGPSLNTPSSLNSNNPSINLQQQQQQQRMHKFYPGQQPPMPTPPAMNSMNPSQGPMGHGQLMAQQQILQQLRMAVQAGLISPQLLNQQLPTSVLVMLQQLLTQQQSLQQLIRTQLALQAPNSKMTPQMQKMQLEQVASRINNIKQQILNLHKNISAAQSGLLGKTPSQQPPQSADALDKTLPGDMQNLSIATSQPQSRLNQWKKTTPDKESPDVGDPATSTSTSGSTEDLGAALNKTVGSKPIQQSSSSSSLNRYDELGLTQLGGDSTWSNNASSGGTQNWPISSSEAMTSADSTSAAESLVSSLASTAGHSSSSMVDTIPAIPEFVPGKPWQGIAAKNVEDDPHITPGSIVRSLSVNTVKDDYLQSLTKSSPNSEGISAWPTKPVSSQGNDKPWSAGESSLTPTSFTSDVWGVPMGKAAMSRPPPGLPQQGQQQKWQGMNRQHSWAGSANRSDGGQWGGSNSNISSTLVLQNLTPEIDSTTLRTLCQQHGPLQNFVMNPAGGFALVKYRSTEEAFKAQKSLNSCRMMNTTITAEFVNDSDVRASGAGLNRTMSSNVPDWGMGVSTPNSFSGTGMWSNSGMGSNKAAGGSAGLWGGIDDNGPHNLLGNMLGESM